MHAAREQDPPRRSDRALLLGFLILYPVVFYPQYLVEIVWLHRGIYFSNGELVYYLPRLVALVVLALLTWRTWTLRGWFPRLLVLNAAWVSFTTLLHPDPDGLWYSLGGNLDRLDGLVFQLLLVGAGLTAYGLQLRSRGDPATWSRRVALTFVAAGVVPAALVLLQAVGVDPVGWWVWGKKLPYPSATLGHPALVACVLLIPAVLGVGLVARRSVRWWSVPILMEALALGVAGNRTALVALAVGAAIVVLVRRSTAHLLLAVVVVGAAVAGGLAPRNYGDTSTSGEAHLLRSQTLRTRLELWRVAGETLVSSPSAFLTGLGPGGMLLAALKVLPASAMEPFWRLERDWGDARVVRFRYVSNGPQLRDVVARASLVGPDGTVRVDEFYPSADKAHDFLLDRALAYGVPDALLWLLLFGGAVVAALRRGPSGSPASEFVAVAVALAVYGLTWFGTVQTDPLQLVAVATLAGCVAGTVRARPVAAPEMREAPPGVSGT